MCKILKRPGSYNYKLKKKNPKQTQIRVSGISRTYKALGFIPGTGKGKAIRMKSGWVVVAQAFILSTQEAKAGRSL